MRHPRSLHRVLTHPPDGGPERATSASPVIHPRPTAPRRSSETNPSSRSSPPRAITPGGPTRRWDAAALLGLIVRLTAVAAGIALVAADPSVPLAAGVLLLAVALVHPRLSDRVLAGTLAVLLLPVLLLIGLCVSLTSPGPVLVRGDNHGSGGTALRFRTTAVEIRGSSARPGCRPTRVGRVLRALTLDELPRLLDVAVGRAPLLRIARH